MSQPSKFEKYVANHEVFLKKWGWRAIQKPGEPLPEGEFVIGRLIEEQRDWDLLCTPVGEIQAQRPKNLRKGQAEWPKAPSIGDWIVGLKSGSGWVTKEVLPRWSCLTRQDVSSSGVRQVLAANVDQVVIVVPATSERELQLANKFSWLAQESEIDWRVVVSKLDLVDDPEADWRAMAKLGASVPVDFVSLKSGLGLAGLRERFLEGQTSVLIGPSGAGKSTLLNTLLGEEAQLTQSVREKDRRGRHTTTVRRLFRVAQSGTMIMDIPGLRAPLDSEVTLMDSKLVQRLEDLSLRCRFSNCGHRTEPGCALKSALLSGEITDEEFQQYLAHLDKQI